MGSAKCEREVSIPQDFNTQKYANSSKSNVCLLRPKFYPCSKCGRMFTIRALEVHKQSCSENADCSCSVCRSLPGDQQERARELENGSVSKIGSEKTECPPKEQKKALLENQLICFIEKEIASVNAASNSAPVLCVSGAESKSQDLSSNNCTLKSNAITSKETCDKRASFFSFIGNNDQYLSADNFTSNNILLLQHAAGTPPFADVKLGSNYQNSTKLSPCNNGIDSTQSIGPKSDSKQYLLLYSNTSVSNPSILLGNNGVCKTESSHNISSDKTLLNTPNLPCVLNTQAVNCTLPEIKESIILESCPSTVSSRFLFCGICNQEIPWEIFGSHIIQHSEVIDSQYLNCPKCFKKFTKPAKLLIHFYKHITDCPFSCKDCKGLFRQCDDLKSHALNVHGYIETQPYHCYVCLRRFSHPQTIINHMRLHSKETPFKCNECSRSFSQIGNLQRHLSVHRGERPHKCHQCDKSFADPATLRNHVRIHTGETPFVCKVCQRAFTQVGNLKRHMARHLQSRPKSAQPQSDCSAKLDDNLATPDLTPIEDQTLTSTLSTNEKTAEESLNNEKMEGVILKSESPCALTDTDEESKTMMWVDENESQMEVKDDSALALSQMKEQRKGDRWHLFTCPVCGKVYTWQHDLTIHFRIHSGEKPYKCELCDKRFAQSGAVRIHKARHHSSISICS